MPRFKPVDYSPKFIPVDFAQQVLPGTFEHALCYLVDQELDLCELEGRFCNDAGGAPAFSPAVLLKIVLLAYSRGIVSSRAIERACRDNVLFMAVSGDTQPHFTTLAGFVSDMGEAVARLFTQVLLICDRQGLIGREMFAIDGVKLPANASKAKSGSRADFERQARKMESAVGKMLGAHRDNDVRSQPEAEREQAQIERLKKDADQIRQWLNRNPQDRKGSKGKVRLSNRTDNESAKMATGKGVIQGYTGVAAVDEKAQVIVVAQAHGTGSEQELLLPVVEATSDWRSETTEITADAGYHSKANLEALEESKIAAIIPDNGYRKRDERYAGQEQHQAKPDPLWDKSKPEKKTRCFTPGDFSFDGKTCLCPAGKRLYGHGSNCNINGYAVIKFQGALQDCVPCPLRAQCLRTPEKTKTRQVAFFLGKKTKEPDALARMRTRVDSPDGRRAITRRFATVEPVFGNLRYNKGFGRFTLRGRRKVDGQWKLLCMMHNIEKLAHHGYGQ